MVERRKTRKRVKGIEGRERGKGVESRAETRGGKAGGGATGRKERAGGHWQGGTGPGVAALPLTSGSLNEPSSKRLLEERSHTHYGGKEGGGDENK